MTRPELRKLIRLLGIAAAVTAACLAGMVMLPHNPYIRWQSVQTEAYARLGWTYERVHYDPTPIDVAFVGTSHTMNGVDADQVQRRMAQEGVRTDDGRCMTATNFAIPSYGRNLHWLVAREILENRKVKVLVLEVFENETRKAHPLFSHVATAQDILAAPMVVNLNWFGDIVRLPFRQVSLWAETLAPEQFGLKRRFSLADYDGSTVDNTRVVNVGGVAKTPPRDTAAPAAELDAEARRNTQSKNLNMLGKRFERYEYAFPRHYLASILDLAKAKGVKVVFLYLPGYAMPPKPYDISPYQGRGDMVFVNDILAHRELWYDANHLNAMGAKLLSPRIGQLLAERAPHAVGVPLSECRFGLAARAKLKPFVKP